ncbi:MAG TPA: NlpC/P60 family protein [Candidatus Woesebacteria bacterium]|nr:NlpC/P60 family protein [Candidatus Woesebacteria bacterium]HPJ17050.1 NlpC/P60 family protein [Candidatus Woesebacteria bacterium]
MAGIKLTELKQEISKYIGIPYFMNTGKHKNSSPEASLVGKGNAKEIALKTVELANQEGVKILELDSNQIYRFQKKHHLGIDCSGLCCQLLNFYFDAQLNVRRTNANMLTSSPLSKKVNINDVKTGDLIRQKRGHHVLFVIEKIDQQIIYVHSSLSNHGVHYGQIDINQDQEQFKEGFFRLLLLNQ